MTEEARKVEFSISRNDLLYSYPASFADVFLFSDTASGQPTSQSGVRRVENEGFDFVTECSPRLLVKPCAQLLEELKLDPLDFVLNVAIEDIGLGIRSMLFEIVASDVHETEERTIDLKTVDGCSFNRGFELRCFVTRRLSLKPKKQPLWHRSQILFETRFIVRATDDDALFEIEWMSFASDREKEDLLYSIKWKDTDVSNLVPTDCFHVQANEALRLQFKRLENNSQFGRFTIRLVVQDILSQLIMVCLQNADLKNEPAPDSLHEKVKALLDGNNYSFEDAAQSCQSSDGSSLLNVQNDVSKLMQVLHGIGTQLMGIKFGGYRK